MSLGLRAAAGAILAAATAFQPVAGSAAEDLAAKLCPILGDVAGKTAGYAPEGVQAQLVMTVAGAYDYDPDALAAVLDGADAATSAACPDARAAILAGTGKDSLASAMR